MDFVRYAWWWVRLKVDPTILKISPEDKVDIAQRSAGLAEHIFFDEGKNDDLTMAHVTQIFFQYLKNDRNYPKFKKRDPQPGDSDSVDTRPPFLQTLIAAFDRLLFTTDALPADYTNNQLRNVFIATGILSENFRDTEMAQKDLDELLHMMIWSLSTAQKITLTKKYPVMAEKILFTPQLKLNLIDTDLKQIIEHYAQQENSRVISKLKTKSLLMRDAYESEALAEAYITAHLLTPEQIIETLPLHSVEFFDKQWRPLQQQLFLADNASRQRTNDVLRRKLFKVLDDYCRSYNPAENNNQNSRATTTADHIINVLSEMSGDFTLKDYISADEYPLLHRRINPWAYSSEIESSDSSSLATTPRTNTSIGNITPRNDNLTPSRSLTPRSDTSDINGSSRSTTPRGQSDNDGAIRSRGQEAIQSARASTFISRTGEIAFEILKLIGNGNEQELNDYLRSLKQNPDSLSALFDLALMRDNITLEVLPKTITKSLFTYDPACAYSIADFDLIAFLKTYYVDEDRDLIDQLFEYYSNIRPQNSMLVNGRLIIPYQRATEKENYDIFYKRITTRGLTSENIFFRDMLFSKYENAKSLLGTPGIINTINLLHTSTANNNNTEIKTRDCDAIKKYFPLLLKAAMNDSTEAKVFMADKDLMTLLKKALANEPMHECEKWRDGGLPMDRAGIESELNFLTVLASRHRDKNFFENDLIIHLLQNSFSSVIKPFASQEEMLSCISKITPVQMPATRNENSPHKQDYLAIVNITFANSQEGEKAKIATAKALQCKPENFKDLDDSFILVPTKDVHSYLTEKLSANGVIPGHYSFNTLLEWDTPTKFDEKPINYDEFKRYVDTGIPPKPKSKLLIPHPDQRINALAERFNSDPEIKETSAYKTLLWIKQKIITPFSAFLTAIDHYISSTTAEKKALQNQDEKRKANTADEKSKANKTDESLLRAPPPTLSLFPPAPISAVPALDSSVAPTALATTLSLAAAGIQLEDGQIGANPPQQSTATWTPPNSSARSSSATVNTNLRIGRGKKS